VEVEKVRERQIVRNTGRNFKRRELLVLGAVIVFVAAFGFGDSEPPLATVPHVEVARYLGRWYEIARYPNRFEKQCDRDVSATYALREDGKISVQNACVKRDGSLDQSKGWAKIVDASTNAKLKVTFFWPFFGDYWVLELGHNYEYAVIGEPGRKYLWILSRTPAMSDAQYREIAGRLSAKGYDAGKLTRVKQTAR
jgi:apolipoprotein D and lipocalin family protein